MSTRQHYHLVVTTDTRDYAWVTRTKAVLTRYLKHFKRYPYRIQSVDWAACSGTTCISTALEILH